MSMPSLVYVLGLSGAVHIVNYYRDTVDHLGFPGKRRSSHRNGLEAVRARRNYHGLGLISLSTSDVVPIRKFGLFSAIGVVFTLTLIFTLHSRALSLWPPKNFNTARRREWGVQRTLHGILEANRHVSSCGDMVWSPSTCLILMLIAAIGLPKMKTSVQLIKLFDKRARSSPTTPGWKSTWGNWSPWKCWSGSSPMRCGCRNWRMSTATRHDDQEESEHQPHELASERYALNFLERMELTEYIRRSVDAHFGPGHGDITGKAMMASTFVPTPPAAGGSTMSSTRRGAYSRQLAGYRDDIYKSDCYRVDPDSGAEIWRLSLRLSGLADVDYGRFVQELKKAIEPVMSAYKIRREILVGIGSHSQRFWLSRRITCCTLACPLGNRISPTRCSSNTKSEVAGRVRYQD